MRLQRGDERGARGADRGRRHQRRGAERFPALQEPERTELHLHDRDHS